MAPTIHLSLNSLRMVVADGVSFLQHLLGSLCASLEDEESDICDADFYKVLMCGSYGKAGLSSQVG